MLLLVQAPARDVELVRPLVARVAVAVVPLPVPVVVEAVAVERLLRRGPDPEVVLDLREVRRVVRRFVVGRVDRQRELLAGAHRAVGILADARARLEAQPASHVDLADAAVVHELDRGAHRGAAPVHRADLDNLAEARRGFDLFPSFPDRVRRGLLDVDVLARLERPDRRERVPVVRRRDDHAVDVLVLEHAAHVLHEVRLEGGDVLQARIVDALGGEVAVDVAEGLDLDVLQLREPALERVALAADADAREHHLVVRAEDPALRRGVHRRPEELAADREACRCRADARGEIAA